MGARRAMERAELAQASLAQASLARKLLAAAGLAVLLGGLALLGGLCWRTEGGACAVEILFRDYLAPSFWQPMAMYEEGLDNQTMFLANATPPAFAGMAGPVPEDAADLPSRARRAYRQGDFALAAELAEQLQRQAAAGGAGKGGSGKGGSGKGGSVSQDDLDELAVVGAKSRMRLGEAGDADALNQAADQLEALLPRLALRHDPALHDEAGGWLARCRHLQGRPHEAARFYLKELDKPSSFFSRQSLVTSLRILFPYNGSDRNLTENLHQYLDDPRHALFAARLVTNPASWLYYPYGPYEEDEAETDPGQTSQTGQAGQTVQVGRAGTQASGNATPPEPVNQRVARQVVEALLSREELFDQSRAADALALTLMRAALHGGDARQALTFAARLGPDSPARSSPEHLWMLACCHALLQDWAAAEAPLAALYSSPAATHRDRQAAAMGLMGVYWRRDMPRPLLHAALLLDEADALRREQDPLAGEAYWSEELWDRTPYNTFPWWPYVGANFDLAYFLDIQLSDEDVAASLAAGGASPVPGLPSLARTESMHAVRYALAVRHARAERHEAAAALFDQANATERAQRMREAARLHDEAFHGVKLTTRARLQARFDYAAFLAGHPEGIFFNDALWMGFQTYVFGAMDNVPPERATALTALERRFQDAQEERWRAYGLFVDIAREAGYSPLGRKAVSRAMACLNRISPRFGREEEIAAKIHELVHWPWKIRR